MVEVGQVQIVDIVFYYFDLLDIEICGWSIGDLGCFLVFFGCIWIKEVEYEVKIVGYVLQVKGQFVVKFFGGQVFNYLFICDCCSGVCIDFWDYILFGDYFFQFGSQFQWGFVYWIGGECD